MVTVSARRNPDLRLYALITRTMSLFATKVQTLLPLEVPVWVTSHEIIPQPRRDCRRVTRLGGSGYLYRLGLWMLIASTILLAVAGLLMVSDAVRLVLLGFSGALLILLKPFWGLYRQLRDFGLKRFDCRPERASNIVEGVLMAEKLTYRKLSHASLPTNLPWKYSKIFEIEGDALLSVLWRLGTPEPCWSWVPSITRLGYTSGETCWGP